MSAKQGKIISKSIHPSFRGLGMENQQVLVGRRVGTVTKYLPSTQLYIVKFRDEQDPSEGFFKFEQLFMLVLQYKISLDKPKRNENVVTTGKLLHVAVKWSQWEQAIAQREVDNNKEVRFELKTITTTKGENTIAKIIPTRERLFTYDDIAAIIEEMKDLSGQFGAEWDLPEAKIELDKILYKYE